MKEVREFYDQFATCREHDIPLCADACPFKLDFLHIQERISNKRFNAAYKAIRDAVTFPGIVSEICPAYCQKHCIREIIDEPVRIKLLEKSVVTLASRKDPNSYNLPARNVKVAVIGGGISGIAFALKMATRKYDVTLFEKSGKIGGQLSEYMDEASYMAEIDLQFKNEKYNLFLDTEASVDIDTGMVTATGEHAATRDDFDVVYIATGEGGDSFGVPLPEKGDDGSVAGGCMKAGETGIFLGGSLLGKDLMFALADGMNMASAADDFIKAGLLSYPVPAAPSKCVPNEHKLVKTPAGGTSGDASGLSEEEAAAEADRCIRCQCDACDTYCDLIKFYKKWPIKMRDELFLSVKPAGSLVHKCPSRKYIAACTDCKIMEETCPENIELCGMIKAARYQMHQAEKMPAAYKQYFIRDMEHANGTMSSLVRKAPKCSGASSARTADGKEDPGYAFFPGCNLGALDPEYVIRPYRWLTDNYPGTGLLLKCCGIPLDWSGNEKAHLEILDSLKADWEELGRPVLVTACMSCDRHLREYLPEIKTVTIYELMAAVAEDVNQSCGASDEAPKTGEGRTFSIFDPCSARGNEAVRKAVRNIAAASRIDWEELPEADMHGCCGFGGQGVMAQPEFIDFVTDRRASSSDDPFIVYCSNCRDIFNDRGKKAVHIFDLLFDIDPDGISASPGVSERRLNRSKLKQHLLHEFWEEEMAEKPKAERYQITMNPDIRSKANKLRILDEDICKVIERAETSGRRTRNPESGHFKAYTEIGAITLWVEYSVPDPGSADHTAGGGLREIHNLYCHRMQIKLEPVFNGRKVEE